MAYIDPKFGCGDYLPGDHDGPVDPPPPDPGTDDPGPGDPYDPPDFEDDYTDDFGDDPGDGGPGVPGPPVPRPPDPPDDGGGGGGAPGQPGTPGAPVDCKCIPSTRISLTPPPDDPDLRVVIWKQKCTSYNPQQQPNGPPNPEGFTKEIDDLNNGFETGIVLGPDGAQRRRRPIKDLKIEGTVNKKCRGQGGCACSDESCCPQIRIEYRLKRNTGGRTRIDWNVNDAPDFGDPFAGDGDDDGPGGAGGAGPLCLLWYCQDNVPRQIYLSISEILGLDASIPGSAQDCGDIPPTFTGSDGITYSKSRPPCGGGGGGGGGATGRPDPGGTAGGINLTGVDVTTTSLGGDGFGDVSTDISFDFGDDVTTTSIGGGIGSGGLNLTGIDVTTTGIGGGLIGGGLSTDFGGTDVTSIGGGIAGGGLNLTGIDVTATGIGGGLVGDGLSTDFGDTDFTGIGGGIAGGGLNLTGIDVTFTGINGGSIGGGLSTDFTDTGVTGIGGGIAAGGLGLLDGDDDDGGGFGVPGGGFGILPDDIGDGVIIDTGGGGGNGVSLTSIGGDFLGGGIVDLNEYNNRIGDDPNSRITDPDIAIKGGRRFSRRLVRNTYGRKDIFRDVIAEGLLYILNNNNKFRDWTANAIYSIDPILVVSSLDPKLLATLKLIRKTDGSPLSKTEISSIFIDRIIEGNLDSLDVSYFRRVANKTRNRPVKQFLRSNIQGVNQTAALALLDKNKYSLDASLLEPNTEARSTVENYKVFATDVAKYLPITVSGVEYKYYINDDDTFIDRSTLSIKDGDYYLCRAGGVEHRIFLGSEKDHAFIADESTRQRAISLLGGQPNRVLDVSADVSAGIEFDYSLSSPRQNAYVMKLVPSATVTAAPKGFLKRTRAAYELMPAETNQNRRDINEYVRYKSNYLTINMDDEDLILDYIEAGSRLFMEQTDILFDSAKTNKNIPIFVRQIPWYIVIVPTNRSDRFIFGTKSRIRSISDENIVTRTLNLQPRIDPEFEGLRSKPHIKRVNARKSGLVNSQGVDDAQAVVNEFDPNTTFYNTNYQTSSGDNIPATQVVRTRRKTGFRLVKEIITELKNNYVLDTEGSEAGLNLFDVFSRLNMTEFNKFSLLEGGREIMERIKQGMIADTRVFPSIRNAGVQAARKTRLVKRRATATTDLFPSVKAQNRGGYVNPPTEIAQSSTITTEPLDDLIAKCTEARIEPVP